MYVYYSRFIRIVFNHIADNGKKEALTKRSDRKRHESDDDD